MDQHMIRSHPNKAVDVVVCPNSWIDSGSRFINSGPALRNQSAWIVLSLAARFPLPPGWLGCRGVSAPTSHWRSGSYTSPLTQRQCSKTASFRATATAALFFAFFPPRSQSRSPYRRKSVSGPNGPKI